MRRVQLTPPDLSNASRGEHIACVRSMRRGGPRVDTVATDDQLITHAYGFGGGGWTLAPGVTRHALQCFEAKRRDFNAPEDADVAIIGGGVIGLSMANRLASRPDIGTITVYAEHMKGLASHNAGGLLAPVFMGTDVASIPWLRDVTVSAYRDWAELARREQGHPPETCAARFMNSFRAENKADMTAYVEAGVMAPPEPVVVQFGDKGPAYPMERFETLFMNTGAMMHRMHQHASDAGVEFSQERIQTVSGLDEPIVFNCAGLGGGALAGDDAMVPALGHLIRLQNQVTFDSQQYMASKNVGDGTTYYIPKIDAQTQGVLGGTLMEGVNDVNAAPESFDAIWERGKTFFYGQAHGRDWYTGRL